jgi:hypothetical protein
MYPLYFEQSRLVKLQMFLSFFYHTHQDLRQRFYVLMVCFGDIFPEAYGFPQITDTRILESPIRNLSWALLNVLGAPRVLGSMPPTTFGAQAYVRWEATLPPVITKVSPADRHEAFERRDSIELPSNAAHEFWLSDPDRAFDISPDVPSRDLFPSFTQPVFDSVEEIGEYYRHPSCREAFGRPEISSHAIPMGSLEIWEIIHRARPSTDEGESSLSAASAFREAVNLQIRQQGQQNFTGPSATLLASMDLGEEVPQAYPSVAYLDMNVLVAQDPLRGNGYDVPNPHSSPFPLNHRANSSIPNPLPTTPPSPFDADDEYADMEAMSGTLDSSYVPRPTPRISRPVSAAPNAPNTQHGTAEELTRERIQDIREYWGEGTGTFVTDADGGNGVPHPVAAHRTHQHIPQPARADTHDSSAASSDDEMPDLIRQRAGAEPDDCVQDPRDATGLPPNVARPTTTTSRLARATHADDVPPLTAPLTEEEHRGAYAARCLAATQAARGSAPLGAARTGQLPPPAPSTTGTNTTLPRAPVTGCTPIHTDAEMAHARRQVDQARAVLEDLLSSSTLDPDVVGEAMDARTSYEEGQVPASRSTCEEMSRQMIRAQLALANANLARVEHDSAEMLQREYDQRSDLHRHTLAGGAASRLPLPGQFFTEQAARTPTQRPTYPTQGTALPTQGPTYLPPREEVVPTATAQWTETPALAAAHRPHRTGHTNPPRTGAAGGERPPGHITGAHREAPTIPVSAAAQSSEYLADFGRLRQYAVSRGRPDPNGTVSTQSMLSREAWAPAPAPHAF